jgi:restriction system protein
LEFVRKVLKNGVEKMSVPKYSEFYGEILEALSDGSIQSIPDLRKNVAEKKGLTDEDRSILLNSGQSVYDNRFGWARTYLKEAGLISFPNRGTTQITEEGKTVFASNPTGIDNTFLQQYPSFREFRSRSRSNTSPTPGTVVAEQQDGLTPAEQMEAAFSEINSSLGAEILSEVKRKGSKFFELLAVKLLVKMGYGGSLGDEAGYITPSSGDEGIDGVIREDKLGFSNIYIQAKRWTQDGSNVGRTDMQKFVGAITNKAGKGLFITTASFSPGAIQCARENHVVLIDGNRLASLMIEYGVGVSTTQTYEIKMVDSDFFNE